MKALTLSLLLVLLSAGLVTGQETPATETLAGDDVTRFAELALACAHQEYPNKIAHVMTSDVDVAPPRQLTPAFFGCFDWHSSVHGHWLLARIARIYPETPVAERARTALARSLSAENLAAEVRYFEGEDRGSYERPYGLAWLLQLAAELRQWDDEQARQWVALLEPLEQIAADRLRTWLPKLAYPIRTGEHSQTAFAFGLALDWARIAGDDDLAALLESRTRDLYLRDRACPLSYEPSGQDFLSPCLAEADLVRRVQPPVAFAAWLGGFLPVIPLDGSPEWLPTAIVTDRSDGKLAHLDGLNLSRAWMLEGITSGLPADDPRRDALAVAAAAHRRVGLVAVSGEHYAGSHWLGTYAVYLVTGRGLAQAPAAL